MIKALVFASATAVIMLGFFMQLTDIAESTSQKTLKYADSMDRAVDCAFAGVDISVCSPELKNTDFKQDAREFQKTNLDFLKKVMNQTNTTQG